MARKPYEPSDKERKQVTLMAGIGLTHDQIASIIGISDETLRKHFRVELDTAEAQLNARVAQNLFNIATSDKSGAVAASIFWMKTRAGWRETNRQEITGPNGGPLQMQAVTLPIDDMDEDDVEQIEAVLTSALERAKDVSE